MLNVKITVRHKILPFNLFHWLLQSRLNKDTCVAMVVTCVQYMKASNQHNILIVFIVVKAMTFVATITLKLTKTVNIKPQKGRVCLM